VYSLADLKQFGEEKKWCPYFTARHFLHHANVVVYNYQYMLDPKISSLVSKDIDKDSIIVFDEAHNIDNICIEALSVSLDQRNMTQASRSVKDLQRRVQQEETKDAARLQAEYQQLVQGLAASGTLAPDASELVSSPVLPQDVLQESIPGNIRKAKHFLMFLKTVIEFMKDMFNGHEDVQFTPQKWMQNLADTTSIFDAHNVLKFAHDRLSTLMRTLQVTDSEQFSSLAKVCNFATLVSTYDTGFVVLFEPTDDNDRPDPRLQLVCVDASLAIRPVFEKYTTVVITSGTLSPMDMYPKMLNFKPLVVESLEMSLSRNVICPMIVVKGGDQTQLSTQFKSRENGAVAANYGKLVLELARVVPDGMVVFFTSYAYMQETIYQWTEFKIIDQIVKQKLIFLETKDVEETKMALNGFKEACTSGRGGIFFSVARGKVAEGVDFNGHYGRAVIMIGVPFQYTKSRVLQARLKYIDEKNGISDKDFLTFDAIRQTSQCAGRVIRSKTDYGLMVFADYRYNAQDKRKKLPKWIVKCMTDAHLNMSTGDCLSMAKSFLRNIAQPRSREEEIGVTFLTAEHLRKFQEQVANASQIQNI
jgi:DNA excision repair protein ERCC-2